MQISLKGHKFIFSDVLTAVGVVVDDITGRRRMVVSDGLTNITLQHCCRHMVSHHRHNLGYVTMELLYHNHVIAHSVLVLKEEGRSTAFDVSFCHDGDPVTKNVSFVREVRGKKYSPSLLLLL